MSTETNNIEIKQLVNVNNEPVYPVAVTDSVFYTESKIDSETNKEYEVTSTLTEVIKELKEKSIDSLEAKNVIYTHNNNKNVEQALDNLYDMINWNAVVIASNHRTTVGDLASTYEIGSNVSVTSVYGLSKKIKKWQYQIPGGTQTDSNEEITTKTIHWIANLNTPGTCTLYFGVYDILKDGTTSSKLTSSNKSISFDQYIYHGPYSSSNKIPINTGSTTLNKSDLGNGIFSSSLKEISNVSVGPKTDGNGYYFLIPSGKTLEIKDSDTNDKFTQENGGLSVDSTEYKYNNGTTTPKYKLWKYENDGTYSCSKWLITIN